ncbi:MAG: phosphatase PAP2 family protein [Desulfobacteraceae bacterium]|nr:MAG: phosphatase PAP2 family protein [Desulfobacteraceae bacterium]
MKGDLSEYLTQTFDWGVDIILGLQSLSPALDLPFKLLTFLGNEGFYLLLLPLVYWCIDRRTGARLAILFLVSAYLNSAAKLFAAQPRPFEYDLRVRALVGAEGGGLPSGHTQHSVVVWGFLTMQLRKSWFRLVAVFFMISVPLSRLYLGVHFPVDLLGGYLLGALLLIAFSRAEQRLERIAQKGFAMWWILALVLPGAMIFASPSGDHACISSGAALMGMSVGMILERRWVGFVSGGELWKKLLRLVIGMAVAVAIWAGLKQAFSDLGPELPFRILRYSLLGLWAALGGPWIFSKLRLVECRAGKGFEGKKPDDLSPAFPS